MNKLRFHPEAVLEIQNSLHWYAEHSKNAEINLKEELNDSFQKILSFPFLSIPRYKSFRSYSLKKFPFQIVYSVHNDIIFVISVFHTSRNPEDLEERISSL